MRSPGQSRRRSRLAPNIAEERQVPTLTPSRAFTAAERVRFCKSKHTYARKQINYGQDYTRTPSPAAATMCGLTEIDEIVACKLIYSYVCSSYSYQDLLGRCTCLRA